MKGDLDLICPFGGDTCAAPIHCTECGCGWLAMVGQRGVHPRLVLRENTEAKRTSANESAEATTEAKDAQGA